MSAERDRLGMHTLSHGTLYTAAQPLSCPFCDGIPNKSFVTCERHEASRSLFVGSVRLWFVELVTFRELLIREFADSRPCAGEGGLPSFCR